MGSALIVIRDAVLIVLAGAFITAIYHFITWLFYLNKILHEMENNGKERRKETRAIFLILKRLMDASKATLETLRDNKCNGNVSTALLGLEKASVEYENLFLEKIGED